MSSRSGAFRDGIRLAYGTLTLIPVRPPSQVDAAAARVAMATGWLLVAPLMLVVGAVGWGLARLGIPPMAVGLLTVGLLQMTTRFIHADGLADTADGLAASWDRQRALDVMRTGDAGPVGVTTLLVVLGTQAACLGALLAHPLGWLLGGAALAVSRVALTLGTTAGVTPARAEGLGSAVAESVPVPLSLVAVVAALAALVGTGVVAGQPWWQPMVAMGVALAAVAALLGWVRRRLGGVTGDVLGAVTELAALALLVVLVV